MQKGEDVEQDKNKIRENAINVHGVDDMSTKDVEAYATHYYPAHRARVEWVNDSSGERYF